MTATTEREPLSWRAHLHIDLFTARDERDALFAIHPRRARMLESAGAIGRSEHGGIELLTPVRERLVHVSAAELLALGADVVGERDVVGNLLVNVGINRLEDLLIGAGGQAYDNTHCALGVGDTATAAAVTDTDMNAAINAANRWFQVMDATFPSRSSQTLSFKATIPTGNGNFHWQEWMIAGNTASGANAATAPALNHKVTDIGTFTSSTAKALTVTCTVS